MPNSSLVSPDQKCLGRRRRRRLSAGVHAQVLLPAPRYLRRHLPAPLRRHGSHHLVCTAAAGPVHRGACEEGGWRRRAPMHHRGQHGGARAPPLATARTPVRDRRALRGEPVVKVV
jgi:hypothetical protein